MTGGPTLRLARWVSAVETAAVPPPVLDRARACLLDALACAAAGAATDPIRKLRAVMLAGESDGPGRTWFVPGRCSVWTEAFVNAACVHALDYDDAHRRSKTHPGAAVIPAVLAAARWKDADLADVFAGLVAGYEVALRLGSAVGVAGHRRSGWHATATCGTLAAAAGVARVLQLDSQRTASALGNAATQAAGLWAFSTDGAMSKKFHPGHAARAGLGAAALANAGVTGSTVALEAADGGFFAAFAPDRSEREWVEVLAGVGDPYWLPEVALKPYPCCRTAHTAVDAARQLRSSGLRVQDVDRVEVRTYRVGVEQCGFHDPVNGTQAAFSTPYVVACALRDGWVSPDHFTDEAVRDPQLVALQRRVRVDIDEELEARFPEVWPARVCVTTTAGEHREAQVDVALGDPAEPMSQEQIEAKVASCLRRHVGDAAVKEFSDRVLGLPAAGPAADLWRALDHWAYDPQSDGVR